MLIHEFDDLMEKVPFHPFRIYTADGRSVRVQSARHAWHAPAERTVWVKSGVGEQGRTHIIDLHLVSKFTVEKRASGNGNGSHRKRN